MDGLSFVAAPPPAGSDPARADIACFAGFVPRRGPIAARRKDESDESYLERLPSGLRRWLHENGWQPKRDGRTAEEIVDLWNVPVPIASWDAFDALFAWEARPVGASSDERCDTLLGAAVRNFFAQGGRNCYVVRLGDPWPVLPPHSEEASKLEKPRPDSSAFLPKFPEPSAVDRGSWMGVGHLLGLSDVSFLCLPDLVELFAVTPTKEKTKAVSVPREIFVECAEETELPRGRVLLGIPAPRFDEAGFLAWSVLVRRIGDFLHRKAPEVQFVAAIPLPVDVVSLAGWAGIASLVRAAEKAQWECVAEIETVFVQLVYPWLRTRTSPALPGGLEPPDGVLAGLLAGSALTRGSWRSAIRQPVPGIFSVEPVLDRAMLERDLSSSHSKGRIALTVRERVTAIGPAPGGFRLLSDVTMDDDEMYRPANVNRLVCAILRAARVTGESAVFQNNGEELWSRLRDSLVNLLAGLWAEGALEGESAEEAFSVRCDRSTMTQADLDAGRVICTVSFTAAAPIVHITVVLAMDEGGHVSLASRQALAAPQSQAA